MKLEAQARTRLHDLMARGGLPASQCGRTLRKLLAPLLETSVLDWERSGAGNRLVVANPEALREFCRHRYPEVDLPEAAESRVAGVGRFRDSKALANTGNEIVSVRAWRDGALLKDGEPTGVATSTACHGVFSFVLALDSQYQLKGRCLLVENPAVFAAAEQLDLATDAVIYGHGRISRRMLDWLTSTEDSAFALLHLPDYDPVGLSEFERLQARLEDRVTLHLPKDLEARFARFSKKELLEKLPSQAMLSRLRRSASPAVLRVVELIDRYNAGLEQEALLVPL